MIGVKEIPKVQTVNLCIFYCVIYTFISLIHCIRYKQLSLLHYICYSSLVLFFAL